MILKLVTPPADHPCELPARPEQLYGYGTVWACDVCGRQARLTEGDQREPGAYWMWLNRADYLPIPAPEIA